MPDPTDHHVPGPVEIDWQRVQVLAEVVSGLPRADDFAARVMRPVAASDEDCFRAFLFAASICHSTHGGLGGSRNGGDFNGWDYLVEAFAAWAERDPGGLDLSRMSALNQAGLENLLRLPFDTSRVTLTDLERRAAILVDVSDAIEDRYAGEVVRLLQACDNRVGGVGGAYGLLRALPGFMDPLEKKSSAFLMAVHFSGRWPIHDQENVRPMIDYHRMRLLLRTGCIVPLSSDLASQLRSRETVQLADGAAIRAAAMEICSAIPSMTGMAVFDFDVLLWALARSCCRNRPLCVDEGPESLSFYEYTGLPESVGCVLTRVCPGAMSVTTRSYWEPELETEDY